MKYIIGIDAGGTKTTAGAYSLSGEKLCEAQSSFGNVTVDFNRGMEHICEAIDKAIKTVGEPPKRIVLGCAGIETGSLKQQAKELLDERYGKCCFVTNDAVLALYAAHKGKGGILLIAGTGSIAYLKDKGNARRFGGWGHLINDDGSGYSIAIRAIRYITYAIDTCNYDNLLMKRIFEHLKISDQKDLVQFVYSSSKGEIASLVPTIEQAAIEGDPQARTILQWAGERLAFMVIGLSRTYRVQKPVIALSGGIIKKMPLVKESFVEVLNEELRHYVISEEEFEPTSGAIYMDALKN